MRTRPWLEKTNRCTREGRRSRHARMRGWSAGAALALWALVGLGLSGAASAATISFSDQRRLTNVDFSGTLSVPRFDVSLGSLSEVRWTVTGAIASILGAAFAVSFGALGPALAEGRAVATALEAIARQPEAAGSISRTLFVGLAMIETTAIYCLVVALLLLFANPFVQ